LKETFQTDKNSAQNQEQVHQKSIYLLLIGLLTFFAFLPGLFANFYIQDDPVYICAIKDWNLKGISSFFLSPFEGYHPLTLLTLSLNFLFSGYSPFSYHLINLIIHIANSILIFTFLYRLFQSTKLSLLASLLFAIHPIQVEAVVWVSSRKDLQYVLFYLLSLHCYLSFLKQRRYKFLVLTMLMFLFSALSKGAAISLPFSLIAIDYAASQSLKDIRLFIEKIPFFCVSVCFAFINCYAQSARGYLQPVETTPLLLEKAIYASYAFFLYLRYFFIPYGLCAYHPYEPLSAAQKIVGLFTMLCFICFLFLAIRKNYSKSIIFAILFFLISISLGLQFFTRISTFIIAERYLYLASAGISLAISYVLVTKLSERVYKITATIILLISGGVTFSQCWTWQDTMSITSNILKFHPDTVYALEIRAGEYMVQKEYAKAEIDLNKAISLMPYKAELFRLRSILNAYLEKREEALGDIERAISLAPSNALLYYTRSTLQFNASNYIDAAEDYHKAVKLGLPEALLDSKKMPTNSTGETSLIKQ
jgi:tetratricopeptide (TPR) repeat protein